MIHQARMSCANGHEWLSFVFDGEEHTDSWAFLNLGALAGSFTDRPPFLKGCPVCGAMELRFEIKERRLCSGREGNSC